jgi:Primosomal protein N'' (replication factor Y) - superfamily II helicase
MKISVLLPNIFNNTFTYISNKKLKPGDMVEVPFGKKKSLGIVWNEKNKLNETIKLKKINKKVPEIRLHEKMIKFIDWFSIYNLIPRGLVLKMCLNYKYLKKEKDLDIIQKSQEKKIFKLNKPQKKALSHLTLNEKKFLVNVLQGVTGSGKTIVYFELIKNFLKNGKQILVLMPEIFLTKQFNKRFFDFFGFEPAVWHSKISPKRRRLIWNGVLNNKVKLVIGARSSLLLPFKNIGTIIVDEEHDSSYKQEEGIKYNARDMAIAKSFIEDIPITLGKFYTIP